MEDLQHTELTTTSADLIINKDTVKTLGIKIPEKLKKEAKMVTTQKKTDKE